MKRKTAWIAMACLVSAAYGMELSVKQISTMVKQIHKKRPSIGLDTLELTQEPFVRKETVREEPKRKKAPIRKKMPDDTTQFALHGLMGGKAYINTAWYEQNETVLGYRVVYIGKRGVVLRKQNYIKTLFLPATKDKTRLIQID